MSASKELEPGTRAMLLLADGLFRFDVAISGDTLRTVIRNLSSGALEMRRGAATQPASNLALGEAASWQPGSAVVEFALGATDDRVSVKVTVGTLRVADRGTVRVTAQAIVREAAAG